MSMKMRPLADMHLPTYNTDQGAARYTGKPQTFEKPSGKVVYIEGDFVDRYPIEGFSSFWRWGLPRAFFVLLGLPGRKKT